MHRLQMYENLHDMLEQEISKIQSKGELDPQSLDNLDKLMRTVKNTDKCIDREGGGDSLRRAALQRVPDGDPALAGFDPYAPGQLGKRARIHIAVHDSRIRGKHFRGDPVVFLMKQRIVRADLYRKSEFGQRMKCHLPGPCL